MGSERIQWANKQNWTFELSSWTPVPVRVSVAPSPSAFGETGQGSGVQRPTYCSASLRATDCNHHKFQALNIVPICFLDVTGAEGWDRQPHPERWGGAEALQSAPGRRPLPHPRAQGAGEPTPGSDQRGAALAEHLHPVTGDAYTGPRQGGLTQGKLSHSFDSTLSIKRNITSSERHTLNSKALKWIIIGHRLAMILLTKHI